MKRKTLIVGCLAFAIVAGTAVWLLASSSRRPGADIPVTLLGYTNDVSGIPTAGYATSNITHAGFALFRAHNPTRRDFFCYIGPVIVHRAGAAEEECIQLCHGQSGDFDLSPGATVTFAVAVPDTRGTWRCGVVLCHRYNYPRWKYALVKFADRCGLDRSERSWFAVSPEIVR